jgi:hypothetical protein
MPRATLRYVSRRPRKPNSDDATWVGKRRAYGYILSRRPEFNVLDSKMIKALAGSVHDLRDLFLVTRRAVSKPSSPTGEIPWAAWDPRDEVPYITACSSHLFFFAPRQRFMRHGVAATLRGCRSLVEYIRVATLRARNTPALRASCSRSSTISFFLFSGSTPKSCRSPW